MLIVLNGILLFTIAAVISSRTKQIDRYRAFEFPTVGKNISEVLEGHSGILSEILQTQARTVVLLFFRGSSLARSVVDRQSLKVSGRYGYLLNPFVLCEFLEGKRGDAH